MTKKIKKILFHSILLSGHLNTCSAIAKNLLNNHSNFEVYFIVDNEYVDKLKKQDNRFKVLSFKYDNQKANESRSEYVINTLEACLNMDYVQKSVLCWKMFVEDDLLIEADRKMEEIIKKEKFDFLICDQNFHLPSILLSNIPYAFVCSYNPLAFSIPNYPKMGCPSRMDEKKEIEKYDKEFEPYRKEIQAKMYEILESRGAKYENEKIPIDQCISNHFNIYFYPSEIDYFSDDIKKEYNLWQVDTTLFPERIGPPFELPENFKNYPIVYISLGTIFSSYTYLMQRLIDILDELPFKYIVSKGPKGDLIKFPSDKFIGSNFLDQLSVLQVVDAIIFHGGNNSTHELAYFGVPSIVAPIIVDQISNATRIEECNYGFKLDIVNYKKEELKDKLIRLLNDEKIKKKCKEASERIKKENKMTSIVNKIVDHINKL